MGGESALTPNSNLIGEIMSSSRFNTSFGYTAKLEGTLLWNVTGHKKIKCMFFCLPSESRERNSPFGLSSCEHVNITDGGAVVVRCRPDSQKVGDHNWLGTRRKRMESSQRHISLAQPLKALAVWG